MEAKPSKNSFVVFSFLLTVPVFTPLLVPFLFFLGQPGLPLFPLLLLPVSFDGSGDFFRSEFSLVFCHPLTTT